MTDSKTQKGGIPTQRKSKKAEASKALTTVAVGAIEKPVATPAISAESMSIDLSGDEDVEMALLRRSMRSKAKPQAFVPGSTQPTKSRGTLTAEQKAARAMARKAKLEAEFQAKEAAKYALPNPEEIEKMRQKQEVMERAQALYTSQMEQDLKRSRGTKVKQMEERRWKAAMAEAEKQVAIEKKEEKKALASEADVLADLFGQMTTLRPKATDMDIDGGKKKRTYKKKSKPQKGGEVEGATENEASLPAPVDQSGGKKKRTYKKKSKAQKGGEVEGAVAENEASLPAPVEQAGGKKKRTKKQNK